jgi:hypothetical protein
VGSSLLGGIFKSNSAKKQMQSTEKMMEREIQANRENFATALRAGRFNRNTPQGGSKWTQDADGNWTQDVTYHPEDQARLDAYRKQGGNRWKLANNIDLSRYSSGGPDYDAIGLGHLARAAGGKGSTGQRPWSNDRWSASGLPPSSIDPMQGPPDGSGVLRQSTPEEFARMFEQQNSVQGLGGSDQGKEDLFKGAKEQGLSDSAQGVAGPRGPIGDNSDMNQALQNMSGQLGGRADQAPQQPPWSGDMDRVPAWNITQEQQMAPTPYNLGMVDNRMGMPPMPPNAFQMGMMR